MLHKAQRSFGGREALASIALGACDGVADEMIGRDHAKIAEAAHLLELGLGAGMVDRPGEWNF